MRRCLLLLSVAFVALAQSAEHVQLDELMERYSDYNGKQIIVSGEVVSGPEMTVMLLPGPPANSGRANLMLITLSDEVARNPGTLEKRFMRVLKKAHIIDIVLQGRFEAATERSFGHQLCCQFRFEVLRVVNIGHSQAKTGR